MESAENEQEKKQSWEIHIDPTQYHNQAQQDTVNLMIEILNYFGCNPYKKEDGRLSVSYEGENFEMEFDGRFVRIWDPVWASIEADDPGLPLLREAVNITNYEMLPTVVMTSPNSKGFIGILSRCNLFLHPDNPTNDFYIKTTLDSFFYAKENVRLRYQQLVAEQSENIQSSRPIGFATNDSE